MFTAKWTLTTDSIVRSCRKVDIIDNMLQRLEKYAENLETQVKRRTVELEDEKTKTEKLLSRMLPP